MKELTVGGPLKVTGTAQLAEIRAALASFFSGAKLTTSGDVGVGAATPTARLEVSTENDRGWDGNKPAVRLVAPDPATFSTSNPSSSATATWATSSSPPAKAAPAPASPSTPPATWGSASPAGRPARRGRRRPARLRQLP